MKKSIETLRKRVKQNQAEVWRPAKWGGRIWGASSFRIEDESLLLQISGKSHKVPLHHLRAEKDRGLIWSCIRVHLVDDSKTFTIDGLSHDRAEAGIGAIQLATVNVAVDILQDLLPTFRELEQEVTEGFKLLPWIPRSLAAKFVPDFSDADTRGLQRWIRSPLASEALDYFSDKDGASLRLLIDPDETIALRVDTHNRQFLESELRRYKVFFDTVEKHPLTQEQREASVTFDDNVLVIAAAGSGKTSTMVAKAGYAIKSGLVPADQILMLAFNRDAADELQGRVNTHLTKTIPDASKITVTTFHAFGLSIIGQSTGEKPRVAPWVDQNKDIDALSEIIAELCVGSAFAKEWALFRTVYERPLPKVGETDDEPEWWDPESKQRGFRSIRGETVKSKEELMIANWLAMNGVRYEYEKKYEFPTASERYSQYHPDFYYPDAQIYHEHFALDATGRAPKEFSNYEPSVEWKRRIHEENGTTLIETTSWSIRRADGFDKLRHDLETNGVLFGAVPLLSEKQASDEDIKPLLRMIRTFLIHVKSNRLSLRDLRSRSKSGATGEWSHPGREALFLKLFERIYDSWEQQLAGDGYVDFEDMLTKAVNFMSTGRYSSPYKLVMADEFQDASIARGHLLRELTKHPDVWFFAVGDDWQSINRFAGADISLMSDFERTFGSRTVSLLSTSFRCPADICEVSSHFIRKNPAQVDKVVSTTNPRKRKSIACFEAKDEAASATLIGNHLELLADNLRKTKKKSVSVLIMGRYRSDQPGEFPQWKNQYRDMLNLAWSTIHGSKGLEADYVFVLNMVQKHRGFPSQIEDDPLLQLAMPTAEEFRYAEERRLFYVALTRAKQVVYVYTQSGRRSEFLVELQKDGLIEIRTGQGGDAARPCPECQRGVLVLRDGKYGEFFGCNRFPMCNYSTNTQDLSPALVGDAAVAGFQYHQGEEVWSTLNVGSQLELVREAANPHDGDAVALYFQGKKLGYIPRGVNSAVAESLDRNEKLIAKVSALSKSGDPYNRVRFSVFHG